MSFFVELRVVDGDHPGGISIEGLCKNATILRNGMTFCVSAPVFSIRQSKYPLNLKKSCVPNEMSKLVVVLSAHPERYESPEIVIKEIPLGEYDLPAMEAAVQETLQYFQSGAASSVAKPDKDPNPRKRNFLIAGVCLVVASIYLFIMTATQLSEELGPVIPGLVIMLLAGGGLIYAGVRKKK